MKTGYSIEIKDYFMLENDNPIVLGVDPITGRRLEDSEDYRKAFEKLPRKKKLSIIDISKLNKFLIVLYIVLLYSSIFSMVIYRFRACVYICININLRQRLYT